MPGRKSGTAAPAPSQGAAGSRPGTPSSSNGFAQSSFSGFGSASGTAAPVRALAILGDLHYAHAIRFLNRPNLHLDLLNSASQHLRIALHRVLRLLQEQQQHLQMGSPSLPHLLQLPRSPIRLLPARVMKTLKSRTTPA